MILNWQEVNRIRQESGVTPGRQGDGSTGSLRNVQPGEHFHL